MRALLRAFLVFTGTAISDPVLRRCVASYRSTPLGQKDVIEDDYDGFVPVERLLCPVERLVGASMSGRSTGELGLQLGQLEAENRSLKTDLATYRHAFETTAADRDRWKAVAERLQAQPTATDQPSYIAPDRTAAKYGRIWSAPAAEIRGWVADGLEAGRFESIMTIGGFSQYTMLRDRHLIEGVVSWQLGQLEAQTLGPKHMPLWMEESPLFPDAVTVRIGERRLSPETLRFWSYLSALEPVFGSSPPSLALEIGGGYGGFARLLKLRYPACRIVLIDIPESLTVARYYLEQSFPGARFAEGVAVAGTGDPDFVLVPAGEAAALRGEVFDLAVNFWSLGEMPRHEVAKYFDLIQVWNVVRCFFTINHIWAPLSLASPNLPSALTTGGWLSRLNERWHVLSFEINPLLHDCPLIRHTHIGAGIVAVRADMHGLTREQGIAAAAVREVIGEDWVVLAAVRPGAEPTGRPAVAERRELLARPGVEIGLNTIFDARRMGRSLQLWRPDWRRGMDSAFFRLWNDARLNGSPLSRRLLRLWLHGMWRAPIRSFETSRLEDTVLSEEYEFGANEAGHWLPDPQLRLTERMAASLVAASAIQARQP